MIKEAVKEYFESFKKEIDKVLNGEEMGVRSEISISPDWVSEYLISKGLEQDNLDSNGWAYDFWMEYTKDEKSYMLSGSGWYNDSIQFSLNEQ